MAALAGGVAVTEGPYPVRWADGRAVVTLPGHLDVSNARQVSEQLLWVINRGAAELIVDMTATLSCDHAGADAVARAYQRAAGNGTQLRLVVTAEIVRRVLSINGLDRLIPAYPSLEAATAAAAPAPVVPLMPGPARTRGDGQAPPSRAAPARRQRAARPGTTAITRALLWKVIDALTDGVALADDDGVLVLVNRRLAEMFGYPGTELAGQPVESLIPAGLRAAHRSHRAGYAREPRARPMGAGARLVGLRQDGATLPVEVSLSPVPTATGHLTLAVIRDVTKARQREDLTDLARAAAAAEPAHHGQDLFDKVVNGLFHVGLSLQEATSLPHDAARSRVSDALQRLDEAIHEIRGHLFATRRPGAPPPAGPPNVTR
jgi:anti-anti-sigma factor